MNYNLLGTGTKLRSVCICTNPNATWWQQWNTLNSQENQQGDCTGDPSCTTQLTPCDPGVPSYATRVVQLCTSRGVAKMGMQIEKVWTCIWANRERQWDASKHPGVCNGWRGWWHFTVVSPCGGRCEEVQDGQGAIQRSLCEKEKHHLRESQIQSKEPERGRTSWYAYYSLQNIDVLVSCMMKWSGIVLWLDSEIPHCLRSSSLMQSLPWKRL